MKVTTKTTIEITIGDEVFQLTKEEAIALRDALNEQVENPFNISKPIPYCPKDDPTKSFEKWKKDYNDYKVPPNYPYKQPEYPGWMPNITCENPLPTAADRIVIGEQKPPSKIFSDNVTIPKAGW
jgi:hypothetical protein